MPIGLIFMVNINTRMRRTDHMFVAAISAIVLDPHVELEDRKGLIIEIQELLPQIQREHPMLDNLAVAAERMVFWAMQKQTQSERLKEFRDGRWTAARALARWNQWYFGQLQASAQDNKKQEKEHATG